MNVGYLYFFKYPEFVGIVNGVANYHTKAITPDQVSLQP